MRLERADDERHVLVEVDAEVLGAGTGFSVNGARPVENNITLDGANNNEVATGGTTGPQPRPDAVQEFRLLTSNYEAEFGRNSGSIVNVVEGGQVGPPVPMAAAEAADASVPIEVGQQEIVATLTVTFGIG